MNNPDTRKVVELGVGIEQWCGGQIGGLRPETGNQVDRDSKN